MTVAAANFGYGRISDQSRNRLSCRGDEERNQGTWIDMDNIYFITSGFVDITPEGPLPLAGYRGLRKPNFDGVCDPIEANVVILRSNGSSLALISLDLLYVGAYLQEQIVQGLSGRVAASGILLSASHTHFAPATEKSLSILGPVNQDYLKFVAERVIGLALRLFNEQGSAVSLEYFEGIASHSINRRKKKFGIIRGFPFLGSRVKIVPNISGPRDDMIRLIRARDQNGRDLAICWSYACHPIGFPKINDLSAEYPGVVRKMLRAEYGDIPIVFWQGFSGNISPYRLWRTSGPHTSNPEFEFVSPSLNDWTEWAASLARCVIAAAKGTGTPVRGPISHRFTTLALGELGLVSNKKLGFSEMGIGPNLVICGLTAEVAVEYGEILREMHAPARVIMVGCVGDVFGYLPVDTMVSEGGYEVVGFIKRFGLTGSFSSNVSSIVKDRLFLRAK